MQPDIWLSWFASPGEHPGDVWLVFSLETDSPDLVAAASGARLDLISWWRSPEGAAPVVGPFAARYTDVWVPVPGTQTAQLFAMAWMGLHGLCSTSGHVFAWKQGS